MKYILIVLLFVSYSAYAEEGHVEATVRDMITCEDNDCDDQREDNDQQVIIMPDGSINYFY